MTRNNLYTDGGEFRLPSGEIYVGPYHVHIDKGAMVGATHVSTPHSSLTPINQGVSELIKTIQDQLRQEQPSGQPAAPARRSSSSGGSSTPASSY